MTQKVILYGGSGGIGSATARLLHARGDQLHLVGRDEKKLAALADELAASYTPGDVTDPQLFARVAEDAGNVIDGLVYAVGTINLRMLPRLKAEDFLYDFQVNSLGAALAVQAALPALKNNESTASVVLYSSVAVQQGFTFHASVSMAKGAVEGLTRSLAAELAPKVRVNAIAPSLVRTPLASSLLANDKMTEAIAAMHAIPRLGEPEDFASLTAFLLSPESGWITGQVIGVDGGRSSLRIKS